MRKMAKREALLALGLCKKAGKLTVGTPLVCRAIASKNPPALAIVSAEASDNTNKRLYDKCKFYSIPIYELSAGTDEISAALGGEAHVAVCAIGERGLAQLFLDKAESGNSADKESKI